MASKNMRIRVEILQDGDDEQLELMMQALTAAGFLTDCDEQGNNAEVYTYCPPATEVEALQRRAVAAVIAAAA